MTPLVVAAVLMAAVTHASWNAIAHGIRDQLLAFTLVGGGGALCGLAMAAVTPLPAAGAWPYLLASSVLHIVYQALLMQSFRLGDFGQMYPIARGTAPLVVTVLAAVFVHEVPNGWGLAGVALASAGLVGVALWGIRGSGTKPHWPALLAALATGLAIASYTTVDGLGVRASGTSLGYIAWLMILEGIVIPVYALATRRRQLLTDLRPIALRGMVGGVLSVFAYGLVLWAQTRAPLAPIAALRESSIIVGAAIGALFFKERFGAPRIAAAGLMVIGIGLMLHTG
ncbi:MULTISPECIES: DMT family transporter [unclassified Streptomyces]|uniref:DMT family transporter n=1 Tax=unclassified Streptomyces TaxID=2593676 RepID=UPI0008845CFA|nr:MULTISPECIES: DMT family transporter [unclassified Streptomyces]PBC82907.1 EamA-like transporter family protein [Streptomyces sp. 2321.6]SDR46353.1 EamA-like transporter family protein [Streptomyces sp. KS_16]SEC76341.1 EamA-like transporter family protein [Streptomyces sp. 2133.1]SNC68983.1 EamA-like transporter family protein [Streptomyces sp. 2114.4]